jgi:hypothetical protein
MLADGVVVFDSEMTQLIGPRFRMGPACGETLARGREPATRNESAPVAGIATAIAATALCRRGPDLSGPRA